MVNNLGVSAMRWVISALLLVLALGGGVVSGGATSQAAAQAVAEETPAQLEGVRVVTPDELRPLLKQGVTVYDLRKKRSEEHTSELQSLMRISYAVFCLK